MSDLAKTEQKDLAKNVQCPLSTREDQETVNNKICRKSIYHVIMTNVFAIPLPMQEKEHIMKCKIVRARDTNLIAAILWQSDDERMLQIVSHSFSYFQGLPEYLDMAEIE